MSRPSTRRCRSTTSHDTDEEWDGEPEQSPRRPRRKLLSPVPLALIAVVLMAGGFLGGVEIEKGQTNSSSAAGAPAGLAALRGGGAPGAGGAGGPGGFAGAAGASGGVTAGQVSYVGGSTLYVTTRQGNTVKVTAPTGTKVSKPVSTNVQSIHPGDTVVVMGSRGSNGSVAASSISIGSSGTGAGSTSSSGSSGSGAGATRSLFGSG